MLRGAARLLRVSAAGDAGAARSALESRGCAVVSVEQHREQGRFFERVVFDAGNGLDAGALEAALAPDAVTIRAADERPRLAVFAGSDLPLPSEGMVRALRSESAISSAPVELIRVQRGGGASWRGAVAEMQGWRADHEDAHFMRNGGGNAYDLFGVLDGHGGVVARLDGNLAVSRGLGDFAYKKDPRLGPGQQKVSCVPECYDLVAAVVDALDAGADVGDVCAPWARASGPPLKDNMALMVVEIGVDGSAYCYAPEAAKKRSRADSASLEGGDVDMADADDSGGGGGGDGGVERRGHRAATLPGKPSPPPLGAATSSARAAEAPRAPAPRAAAPAAAAGAAGAAAGGGGPPGERTSATSSSSSRRGAASPTEKKKKKKKKKKAGAAPPAAPDDAAAPAA
ncbi:manganese ion binding protein [Aureococcus anophagefferens]|nr:manganese ion binding protein [Aureococcus anophagefferens]